MSAPSQALSKAIALHQAGDYAQAEATYRRLLSVEPRQPQLWHLLGILCQQQGRIDAALECLQKAVPHEQPSFEYFFKLALLQQQQGFWNEAKQNYLAAMEQAPDDFRPYLNLGSVCEQKRDPQAALKYFQQAEKLNPDSFEAVYNQAVLLMQAEAPERAVALFRQAIALRPEHVDARHQLGVLYHRLGKVQKSKQFFQAAARLDPKNLLRHLRIDAASLPVFRDWDHILEYRAHLAELLRSYQGTSLKFNWEEIIAGGVKPPFCLPCHGLDDLEIKRLFAEIFRPFIPKQALPRKNKSGPVQVGIVVTQGHHGVFLKGMKGILRNVKSDQPAFHVLCHPAVLEHVRKEIANPRVQCLPLPKSFSKIVKLLRQAAYDVLYYWEIGTDSTNYFLPMWRLAPVQCTSWGWPDSSGIENVDYYLSSTLLEPAHAQNFYSERLYLTDSLPTYFYRPEGSDAGTLSLNLRNRMGNPFAGKTVYLCPQNPRKIHPDFDLLAEEILRRDPNGLLLLIQATQAEISKQLQARLEKTMPDAVQQGRVVLLPRMSPQEYLELLRSADVVLDTLHYGGGANTTLEAFACGKPPVTLVGDFHRGRFAYACYQKLAIEDGYAFDAEEFIGEAVRLGTDREYRAHLEKITSLRSGALFEDRRAVQDFEDFFLRIVLEKRMES